MRNLSDQEAIALYNWGRIYHSVNWGTWKNYPLPGCSYLQFDTNPLVVKFDQVVKYRDEKFKRLGWERNVPGKGLKSTFGALHVTIPSDIRPPA